MHGYDIGPSKLIAGRTLNPTSNGAGRDSLGGHEACSNKEQEQRGRYFPFGNGRSHLPLLL
jgi:hypothetical protein